MTVPRFRKRRSFRLKPTPIILGAVVILVVGVWVGPRLFDWSNHRAAIEAAASGFLGRNVLINGPIRLTLLPHPSITAERVDVQDGGDGVRMAARGLTLNLSLGALLTGRVDVTHVTLERPDIRLPWPLPNGPRSIEPPPWLASLSAEITRGRLFLGPLDIEDASLTVATGGADAALQMDGSATVGGKPWQVSLALAWPHMDGGAPIKATIRRDAQPSSTFDFAGEMKQNGTVGGTLTAHGEDLSFLLPTPPLAFDASGALAADKTGVRLDGLNLVLGTMPADGSLTLTLPTTKQGAPMAGGLAIGLHTPMLDLAPWLAAFPAGSATAPPMTLALDADAVIFGQGLMRRVGLKIATSATGIHVDSLHASLPGEADLALAGDYDSKAMTFTGHMGLRAPSPGVTLHWLVASKLAPDVSLTLSGLGSLAASSNIVASSDHLALTSLTGRMNDTTVTGDLVLGLGDHPSIGAGLAFGKIDLGNWLPPAWLSNPPRPDVLVRALQGVSADLRLSAAEVWLGDEEVDHVVVDAGIANGGVNLRRFAGQDQNLQIVASGAIDPKGVVRQARLAAWAQPATRLMGVLPARLRGDAPFWSQPFAASVTAQGPPEALALMLNGSLGDTTFSAQPMLDLRSMRWHGPVTLRHPNATRLLREIGFRDATAWLGEGSLSLVGNVASDPTGWRVSPLTFSIGMLHGAGSLSRTFSRTPDDRGIRGTLAIDTLPWPDPDPDEPIPVELLRGWNATLDLTVNQVLDGLAPVASHVVADAGIGDGALTVALKSATVLGGIASGDLLLDGAKPPRLTASLALSGAHLAPPATNDPTAPDPVWVDWLPFGLTADRLDGQFAVTATGYSLASWLSSLGGTVSAKAARTTLSGLDLAAAPKPGLFGGTTAFAAMAASGRLAQGNLRLDGVQFSGDAGGVEGSGQVDLVRGICNLNLVITPRQMTEQTGGEGVTAVVQGPIRNPSHWIVHGPSGS
jgi:hypothetical protein